MALPRALPLLLLVALLVPALAVRAAEPDFAGGYAAIKADLKTGDVTQAQARYDSVFRAPLGAFPPTAQRVEGGLAQAAAHQAAGDARARGLEAQVVDKGLLEGAFRGTVHELEEADLSKAAAWFAVLRAKFPNAAEALGAFDAIERDPSLLQAQLPLLEQALVKVFTGKVREEVAEVQGNWAQPAVAEEKAVEGIAYYHGVEPYVGRVLGDAAAAEALHGLEALRAGVQQGDRAAADGAADEVLQLLARFEAGGQAQGSLEATRFLAALDGLVHEYNEYVRDGQVVDRAKYDAEVLGLFLPQVHRTWEPVRAAIAARDAQGAEDMARDVAALDAKVREPAPNGVVEALALDLRSDVQRALAPAQPAPGSDALAGLEATRAQVARAVQAYAAGDRDGALRLLAAAYLETYAPRAEAAVPRDLNADIERLMNIELRDLLQRGAPFADVQAKQAELDAKLQAASTALAAPPTDAGLFANSFLIIAREGFEAALVLAAVIAYLVRMGRRDKTRDIYLGAGLAVLASLALFALVSTVLTLSGANREVLEGLTALLAVVVLFYVSYWLIDKVQIKRWNRFIQGKVRSALADGGSFALVSVAFLAVFREGFETVLFYQALLGGASSPGAGLSVLGGFVVGFAVLAAVFLAFTKYGVAIPMRPFFILTSAMLYYLAFAFMGAGVHELQEAGVVGTTGVPALQGAFANPVAELLGLHATVETLAAQALLLAALAAGLVYSFVIVPRRETDVLPVGTVEV